MKFKKLLLIKKFAFGTILSLLTLFSFLLSMAQLPPPTIDMKIERDGVSEIYLVYDDFDSASFIISQSSPALPHAFRFVDSAIDIRLILAAFTYVTLANVKKPR